MSGAATFAGTTYQARVIAHIYVHILAQARLNWLALVDDTPVGISGETDGPGDDARVEFGSGQMAVEVQAKHGLKAGAKMSEAVARVRERSTVGEDTKVIFVVDRGSSRTIAVELARDLERFSSGRTDGLRGEFERLAAELGDERELLRRLSIVTADLDAPKDPEAKLTMKMLESVLEDPSQADAAFSVLVTDAGDLCAKRLRRTRKDLVDLLGRANIKVRLPSADEKLSRQLDLSKRLLAEDKHAAAIAVLAVLDAEIEGKKVEPVVRYRIAQHRSAALLGLGRSTEALAAARVALDIDPSGFHALLVAAQAAAELGDFAAARTYADRAITIEPVNSDAWGAKSQIEVLAGESMTTPPVSVESSEHYRVALAQIALNALDWQRVADITAEILARGSRDVKVLRLRATALVGLSEGGAGAEADAMREDAERLVSEAIDAVPSDSPLAGSLLVLRAEIRRARGNENGSDADLSLAVDLNDRDPDAVANRVLAQLHAGKAEQALRMLQGVGLDDYPMLLALRAQALAETGDGEGARRDMDAAFARADDAWRPDAIRICCAETALTLGDAERADRYLAAVTDGTLGPEMQSTLRGRLAALRNDREGAIKHFRAAVAQAPRLRARLLAELAQRLRRMNEVTQAIEIFEEVGLDELPREVQPIYAEAIMEAHDLVRADALVRSLLERGDAPEWALSLGAEVAARQGDAEKAVQLLTRMAEKRPGDRALQLELSRRLLLLGKGSEATTYLEQLLAHASELTPRDRMAFAHLLKEAARLDDAVREAFAAFRAAPQDPSMHRGFGALLATDAPVVQHPGVVGDGTYVRLISDEAEPREYVVYADGPTDALRNEISLADAERLGIVGKREGDSVELHAGTWQAGTWKIQELLPAVVYVFRDVMARFEQRFPNEPFFVRMMKLPDENSVKFLTPIISTLQSRRDRAETVFKMYRESTLPLGFVAKMLDSKIADVMAGATSSTESLGPLAAEWFDKEGQDEAADAARTATTVVVTRSALETLRRLDMLTVLKDAYDWWVPKSLMGILDVEIAEAERATREGRRSMMSSDTGLRLVEIEPGDPTLASALAMLQEIRSWVEEHAAVQFRPLAAIAAPQSKDEDVRTSIGHDSFDAVELTQHARVAMLADDLGLRRLLPKGSLGRSFSTVSLLPALVDRGILSPERATELLLKLVEQRYVVILPTRSLLLGAIRRSVNDRALVGRTFGLLGGPAQDLATAARVAAETIRAAATGPVHVMSTAQVARLAIDGLSLRWSPALSAYALLKACAAELVLLPRDFGVVRSVAAAYVRQHSGSLDRH